MKLRNPWPALEVETPHNEAIMAHGSAAALFPQFWFLKPGYIHAYICFEYRESRRKKTSMCGDLDNDVLVGSVTLSGLPVLLPWKSILSFHGRAMEASQYFHGSHRYFHGSIPRGSIVIFSSMEA